MTQTASPKNLAEQYAVNKASYESQLEKLKIDLASIDNEQKNIEEMFLEYVRVLMRILQWLIKFNNQRSRQKH